MNKNIGDYTEIKYSPDKKIVKELSTITKNGNTKFRIRQIIIVTEPAPGIYFNFLFIILADIPYTNYQREINWVLLNNDTNLPYNPVIYKRKFAYWE